MMRVTSRLPLPLSLSGVLCVLMFFPSALALKNEAFLTARAFFYAGLLGFIIVALIAMAIANRPDERSNNAQFLGLVYAFLLLPALAAIPFYEALRTTSFTNAYVEMLSALSTTGLSLYETARLDPSLHLWRSLVAWYGGGLIWVMALAVLAPMNLGGYELMSQEDIRDLGVVSGMQSRPTIAVRFARAVHALVPVYVALTAALAVFLFALGDSVLVAICHAMATLSSSAISPLVDLSQSGAGRMGEAIILVFFVFTLTRYSFSQDLSRGRDRRFWREPEMRIALALIALMTFLILLRAVAHLGFVPQQDQPSFLSLAWGNFFTIASFLSTTGFVSADWIAASPETNLVIPGLFLLFLVLIGGGVATTAGGIKLLRVFVLYRSGRRELHQILYLSAVLGPQTDTRDMGHDRSFVAWVFVMIFVLMLALMTLGFAACGLALEAALTLAVATLSTTGPVIEVMQFSKIDLGTLSLEVKLLACISMILGRLECLAVIAFFFRDFRRG